MRRPGYSLVGVLAALLILTTALIMIFRFNFLTETWFHRNLTDRNALRYKAWRAVRGEVPELGTKSKSNEHQTIQWTTHEEAGVRYLTLQGDDQQFYVLPPPDQWLE